MEFIKLGSTNLHSVGYRSEDSLLLVQFNNGAAYEYYDVPQYVYDDLLQAESKGKYFAQVIRNRYACKKTQID